jgi:hypothetical protein
MYFCFGKNNLNLNVNSSVLLGLTCIFSKIWMRKLLVFILLNMKLVCNHFPTSNFSVKDIKNCCFDTKYLP